MDEKVEISKTRKKNETINNIIDAIVSRNHFLILGHKNADEDCIASMVAIALLINKFFKDTKIFLGQVVHEHFLYLLNICKFNSIQVLDSSTIKNEEIDTIVICDTPKPSMIDLDDYITTLMSDQSILKIEIDHHLGADSMNIGDEGYCLIKEASSSSELVGQIGLRINKKKKLLKKYHIVDLFSRNIVLSILSGILGDSKMGKYLKSTEEKRYYQLFSKMFDAMLIKKTLKVTNFSNKKEVFEQIESFSKNEEECYNFFYTKRKFSKSIGYIVMNENEMTDLSNKYDNDIIVPVSRAVADDLAEEGGKFGLVVFYDVMGKNDLIQFRMRRSRNYKKFDLRELIPYFHIKNGGGHEGAIGFRFNKSEIEDLDFFVCWLIDSIDVKIN